MKKLFLLATLYLMGLTSCFSQESTIDSLMGVVAKEKDIHKKLININHAVHVGWYYGLYDKAVQVGNIGLKLANSPKEDSMKAVILNNMGIAYDYKGDYTAALKHFYQALRLSEKVSDPDTEAYVLSNIGLIYANQKQWKKALTYHEKSYAIRRKHQFKKGLSASANNMAIVYMQLKKFKKASFLYLEAVRIDAELHDTLGLGDDYNNLGVCYNEQKKYKQAETYYQLGLKYREQIDNQHGVANSHLNLGTLFTHVENLELANSHLKLAQKIAEKLKAKDLLLHIYISYSELEEKKKNYQQALEYLYLHNEIQNELENEANIRQQTQEELTYQFEKKEAKRKMEQLKIDMEIKKKQEFATVIIISIIFVLLIIVIFTLMLLHRWRQVKDQKQIIEEKNRQVELKNNEILDSITYAKRIQTAILPSNELLNHLLPNHFVYYLPKDIVAGDFYWLEQIDQRIFLAVADCTGHGVPGAMMSVVCHNALNRSIKEFGQTETGKILDKTREIIIEELSKNNAEVYDGMDISMISWEKGSSKITWSGANNPLWIWRSASNELDEFKPDKQPIGKYAQEQPFSSHQIQVDNKDRIFLFTDGFADQFGGLESKKLKTKNLKRIISESCTKAFSEQGLFLHDYFEEWKGALEQIDDVCILGLSLN